MPSLQKSVFTDPQLCVSTEPCPSPYPPKDAFGLCAHYRKNEESAEA